MALEQSARQRSVAPGGDTKRIVVLALGLVYAWRKGVLRWA